MEFEEQPVFKMEQNMTIDEMCFEQCESCKEHEDIYFYKVDGEWICSCDECPYAGNYPGRTYEIYYIEK